MMGKTHLAIGLATAFAVMRPENVGEALIAVIGGTVGGVIADSDILDNDHRLDTFSVQLAAAAVTIAALVFDYFGGFGICESIAEDVPRAVSGGVVFAVLWILGVISSHRTFTHSLTALVLFSFAVGMIYAPFRPVFAAAYVSHIVLDLTNKRKLPILYPLKLGVCLKLFYADGLANRIFFTLGCVTSGALALAAVLEILL